MLYRPAVSDRAAGVTFRLPTMADAPGMHSLVSACPPLDANSTYAYLLLACHFSDTCRIAEDAEGMCGLVTGYRRPDDPATLFIWQLAVAPRARSRGLANRLVAEVTHGTHWIETTISPGNLVSERVFRRLASCLAAPLICTPLFSRDLFIASGDVQHEEEILYRIGPCQEHP